MEDLNVVDLTFVQGFKNPTMALICKVKIHLIVDMTRPKYAFLSSASSQKETSKYGYINLKLC